MTCDEKWIYFNNGDKQREWLNGGGQVAELVAIRDRFWQKALLCVWWNFDGGVIHFELVPNGRSIDADLFCAKLDRMHAALSEKYLALTNRKRILFQHYKLRLQTT